MLILLPETCTLIPIKRPYVNSRTGPGARIKPRLVTTQRDIIWYLGGFGGKPRVIVVLMDPDRKNLDVKPKGKMITLMETV